MTPKERAAIQQALEALEMHAHGAGSIIHTKLAWDALREALAEPDIEEMTLTQIAARHEQAEQEPVIDLSKVRHEYKCCYWDDETFCNCGADSHALLEWHRNNKAAPVQQVDLTDEEELELARSSVGKSRHWLVAAAIAKFKEKNRA